uniref:60S acidic ribosomal protein P2B-like n=1 Tax=Nicotiana tabacum TaxID=4097 RepID=A0A1S4DAE9_TOBAC|nr:PREDICTED: 60S acidic ribosomal protein P2B-like [Nicotiana tabacum]
MKVIAAYLLAQLGGNTNPSADDLRKILNSVACCQRQRYYWINCRWQTTIGFYSVAFGCGAASSVVNGAESNVAEVAVEEKKEEEKKEESDEEDFYFSLFD